MASLAVLFLYGGKPMAKPLRSKPNNQWDILFQLAEKFYFQYGHLLIPRDLCVEDYRLGRWIGTQRQDYRKRANPFFTQDRVDRLESIGMVWDVKEATWQSMLQELERYSQRHSITHVPLSYITSDGKKLGSWLNKQRINYKRGKLLPQHQTLLEQVEVIWEPEYLRQETWDIYFQSLTKYVRNHDGVFPLVSYITADGLKLGQWLGNQRSHYHNGTLLPHRQDKLADLGVWWSAFTQHWDYRYRQAEVYYQKHGNLCLSLQRGEETTPKGLGHWLSCQRNAYNKRKLSVKQIQQLENLDMIWDVKTYIWEQMYWEAVLYFKKHDNLWVVKNSNCSEKNRLWEWLSTQRTDYRNRTNPHFTEERICKLEAIGIIWDTYVNPEVTWKQWYDKASDFFQVHCHLSPPNGPLNTWIIAQRSKKRGGTLSLEKIQRLESVGMIWEPKEDRWQSMYRRAQEYYNIHQMLNIPCSYISSDGAKLGQWLARQRSGYKNLLTSRYGDGRYVITPEHAKQLNQIGMIWDGDTTTCHTSQQEKAILYYIKQVIRNANKLSKCQHLGFELDIYLASLNVAIEYDGVIWHKNKLEQDENKGRACKENGIRLIRIREPGLPLVINCDFLIQLKERNDRSLEEAIRRVFEYLGLPDPDCDIARDCVAINKTYKDYISRRWDQAYEAICQHHNQYRNFSFPKDTKNSNGTDLRYWIGTQRKAYKKDELTPLQIQKLEQIGMMWDPFEIKWIKMFQLAEKYSKEHGDLLISEEYHTIEGTALGAWISTQRAAYRKGTLTPRRIHLLEPIGMLWQPLNNKWNCSLEAAKIYKKQHEHLLIPVKYIAADGRRLGSWLSTQRRNYHAGKLSSERIKSLEELGMDWTLRKSTARLQEIKELQNIV